METAYSLIVCDLGSESYLTKSLKKSPGVKEVLGSFGAYDFVVKLEGRDLREIGAYEREMKKIDHIRSVMTIITKKD